MTSPEGGFYATQDADSEGEEGKFYVWTLAEVDRSPRRRAGQDVRLCLRRDRAGNWEGTNILNLPKTLAQAAKMLGPRRSGLRAELAEDRARLLAVRDRRVPPGKDTKVLTSWNGLMIGRPGRGAPGPGRRALPRGRAAAAGFLLDRMRTADGRLLHSYKDGQAEVQRLSRRLRQPDRRPDAAVRGLRRGALDGGGARPLPT